MKDAYITAFFDVVKDTQHKTGYDLPVEVEHYIVCLLANFIERPDFLPENTFAESYLKLQSANSAKELADCCLFVTGVFPSYGNNRGIHKSYYTNIGKTSYNLCSKNLNGELFNTLSIHFDFLQDFINLSVNPSSPNNLNSFLE